MMEWVRIYIKGKRRDDSGSLGRWDDSWVGYMIACSAGRYVNVAKGLHHLYEKVPGKIPNIK